MRYCLKRNGWKKRVEREARPFVEPSGGRGDLLKACYGEPLMCIRYLKELVQDL
jgi:hypothetical protein